ncbi:MAG: type IV toxin-antitoxin system AbiEi family antitoxin domain-containing protein [Planctomycetes bacterium]|nr:type IV toxin-antitoxin system AbiEi family antitoxin domain-containing protein [Planctomycetota bacterium]
MSKYRATKKALRTLSQIAGGQGGYFTAKQARETGYDYPHLDYHVEADNFERVGHGLYRLPTLPLSEHDDLIRLSLWSRNRNDEPQAVASHETALFLHELSDVLPKTTHLTVPPQFRKQAPRGCVLHKTILTPADIEERDAFRVTAPLRTLLDAAGTISEEELAKAISDALARGLVRRRSLDAAIPKHAQKDRLYRALALVHNQSPTSRQS